MSKQYKINEAVNYWNEHRSWAWIFSVLDLAYRTEPKDDGGTRFIVHNKYDPQEVKAVAEEYASGTSGKITILSKRMLGQPDLVGVSMDMNQFFCFFISPEIVLKSDIIPFYESHLRDLAAEESIEAKKKAETENNLADLEAEDEDDTTEDTTTKKGATTMKTQELQVIDSTDCDADFICSDSLCQGEEMAKLAISSENWDLIIKDGEYFFQHQDPNYVTGKLTMLEPGIVDGRAKAIFIEDNQEYFQVLDDEEKINAIIEDNYEVKRLVERANAWISNSSPSSDK